MFTRVMLIGLLLIGAVAMYETDANARSCGLWGCSFGSLVMCAELKGASNRPSIVTVVFNDVVIEAVCIGPQGQVVNGQASLKSLSGETTSDDFEVDETGKVTACVEVQVDIPDNQICNNQWTKARRPDGTPSDAIIAYSWIGQWFACQPESRTDPDPCHNLGGALTIASSPFDTDTGTCSGEPVRDEFYVPIAGIGSCDCTEINPD